MAEALPKECLSHVISLTSPGDACRSSLVSRAFKEAADSDLVWDNFLPSDYPEILSNSANPVVAFSSKKDLFRILSSTPILIQGAQKLFWVDKCRGKKCYMLSGRARQVSIAWATNPLFWCWKHLLHSRFCETVELIMVPWLEIKAKIERKTLSPKTTYGAYVILQITHRAFGLDVLPMEMSLEMGTWKTQQQINICMRGGNDDGEGEGRVREREDGWLEVEVGEFYNHGSEDEVVLIEFKETKGHHLKGGLLFEGIELRPKLILQFIN